MRRWSALVAIVKSFNERGSPRLAFATVLAFLVPPIFFAVLVAYKVPGLLRGP